MLSCEYKRPRARTQLVKKLKKALTESQRQVQEWVSYIEGRGRKPKVHNPPTLISDSRTERAANKPLIWRVCEGKDTKLFLDSGAEINVIDKKLFDELRAFSGNKVSFSRHEGTISCANGSKMQSLGETFENTSG
jgi:hypothetical protein